ncbi:ribose-phosphate pyrophosphokinase [bacterium]|nr:ribose-phosphate pyrophosphokinase [bacterium]
MSETRRKPRRPCNDFLQMPIAPVGIIATPGGRALAERIDKQLKAERQHLLTRCALYENCPGFIRESYLIDSACPRFSNGEGKAAILESIRGFDLYLVTDINNWGITYQRNGQTVTMSPDEHFQDLKRLISAARGFGQRVNVIMPLLYEGRQHKISGRESLDCALALQELVRMGVSNIMTIDAHNSHVQNAVPNYGFENLHANYQQIKAIVNTESGFRVGKDLIVTSPDLGGLERCRYFAEHLQTELTAFYKLRDLSRIVDGRNPVAEHRFLGGDVAGKDAMIVDDILASGDTVIDVATTLKERGAQRIFIVCTFALFTSGIERFEEAYRNGVINRVYGSNATYVRPDALASEWYVSVDTSRFIALYIDSFNRNESVSRLLDNTIKIQALLERKGLL